VLFRQCPDIVEAADPKEVEKAAMLIRAHGHASIPPRVNCGEVSLANILRFERLRSYPISGSDLGG